MKKITVIGAVVIMLVLGHWTQAGVSMVRNGSFEDDGQIADITAQAPRYWCDVNLPSGEFVGKVDTDWWTHSYNDSDGNSLTLYTNAFGTFEAGEAAMVSQQVYLTDVNEIIFDLKLSSSVSTSPWDPNTRTAFVLIDNESVWDSNGLEIDEEGGYLGRIEIDANDFQIYKDANSHTMSLALRVNVDEDMLSFSPKYTAQWDFVKFDTHCGGFGYLPEDLNYDCYVDMLDLKMLAGQWLVEAPDEKYDLFEDGIVNFYDFVFFAEYWMTNSDSNNWGDDNCYEVELPAGDIDDSGQVDLRDVSIFTGDWLAPVDCDTRADINGDDVVDFQDFAVLAEEWRQKSWLYGL
jgi:hypothetical protein